MPKRKEEHQHIANKDKGDDISKILGDIMQETSNKVLSLTFDNLLINTSKGKDVWYQSHVSSLSDFRIKLNKIAEEEKKRLIKASKQGSKEINLSTSQSKGIERKINQGINDLKRNVLTSYTTSIATIAATKVLKNNVTDGLYKTIKDKIESMQNYGIVAYKNGRNVRWENYMEMKVRTDIQNDITKNMIKDGQALGNVFYIAAYFGDCAKDHADYQGKIYVDDNWESIAPKDRFDEIQAYISSHSIKGIKEITENQPYFTTRPNCRHYFQMISIDEVLGIKNSNDLNQKREEFGLNFNGKYKPEKYEALGEQRYNERAIRHWKGKLEADQKLLEKMPSTIPENERLLLNSRITLDKRKIREWQARQRSLIKENPDVLERNYDREAYNRMISDFGIRKELTKPANNGKINVEIDELTPCLRRMSDGKIVNTIIEEINPTKKEFKDWEFDWTIPKQNGNSVYALKVEGDNKIQGMIATKPEYKDYKAVIVDIVESAPFNNPHNKHYIKKEYAGVGGHLFAFAVKQSYEFGLDGVVIFQAKTNLISHYEKELGAILINPKERLMMIDEYGAKRLYERYYRRK